MNGKQFSMILHSDIPSLHTSFQVFHQHPLFSPAGAATGGWMCGGSAAGPGQGGDGGGGRKQRMQLTFYLWRRTKCSCVNVVVRAMLGMSASALPGPDQRSPQLYLRKWQSGAHWPILLRSVSVCSAQSAPSFLVKNDHYFPLWKK